MSAIAEPHQDEIDTTERGKIVWASSEEGAGPDVGISIGLGNGQSVWIGEISRALHAEGGVEVAEIGDDCGHWIVLYDETKPRGEQAQIVGKAAGRYVGPDLCDALHRAMLPASPPLPTRPSEGIEP